MSKEPGVPPNWPRDVEYLTTPQPSPHLPRALRPMYCSPAPASSLPNPSPRLSIKSITTPGHPAQGQRGLFNIGKRLEKGTWIRDYIGIVHTDKHDCDPTSDYDLTLERKSRPSAGPATPLGTDSARAGAADKTCEPDDDFGVVAVDATRAGNEARFVNDFRGVADKPNAVFELRDWKDKNGQVVGRRMAVWAGPKGVEKGAEICVSYGKGFWRERARESLDKS